MSIVNTKKYKKERLTQEVPENSEISTKKYNLTIGLTMLWGVLINVGTIALFSDFFKTITKIQLFIICIVYLIGALVIGMVVNTAKHTIARFLGFTIFSFLTSMLIGGAVLTYTGTSIIRAFVTTVILLIAMIGLSQCYPQFFKKLWRVLLFALLGGLIIEIIMCFVLSAIPVWWDFLIVALFCLLIGMDWQRAQDYPKTLNNAIASALDIYLDIVNIFLRLLRIGGNSND